MENNSLFANISEKIKISAKVICVLGIILSIVLAIFFFVKAGQIKNDDSLMSYVAGDSLVHFYVPLGFIFLIGGPIYSVITSFLIYGFGVLIESTNNVESKTEKEDSIFGKMEEIAPVTNSCYCIHCGATVKKSDRYCPACSNKLNN